MADTLVRTFRSADLSAVLNVWNRALPRNPINANRFAAWLFADADYAPGENSGFFVAEQGGQVRGFCRTVIRHCPNDRLGIEPLDGWLPALAVDPAAQGTGLGRRLFAAARSYLRSAGRQRVWVCGTPTSAPGSFVPGVDIDTQPAALRFFQRHGLIVDQAGFSMAREVVDFDVAAHRQAALSAAPGVTVSNLTPQRGQDFLVFLAESLPGAWCLAGRSKLRSGRLDEILVAELEGRIVGYCQWTGEHFGPFGVSAAVRNLRVGARLFVEALDRIRSADGRRVWFNWSDENAARFYRRFGLVETRRFAILRGPVDEG